MKDGVEKPIEIAQSSALQWGFPGGASGKEPGCQCRRHGQRSLAGYSRWGCKESDTTEQVTHIHSHLFSEGAS